MKIQCPGCGVSGAVNDSYYGRKIRCPKCGEVFRCRTGEEPGADELDDHGGQQDAETLPQQTVDRDSAQEKERWPEQFPEEEGGGLEVPLLNSSSTGESPQIAPPIPAGGEGQSVDRSPGESPETFSVGGALSSSWELTRGAKGQVWIGILILIAVLAGLEAAATIAGIFLGVNIVYTADVASVSWASVIYECVSSGLSTIITAGIMYMGVTWVRDNRITWRDVFSGFPTALSIIIAMVLQFILLVIGYFLLILPGIYLTVGYSMVMPLIIDRKMSPWQAMEASRRAVHKVWWKMFGLMCIMMLIITLSAIPFGIGLIWTVPMGFILSGLVYTYLFPEREKS